MPSQLVEGLRRALAQRREQGAPITAPERALMLAALARTCEGHSDPLDQFDSAITAARNAFPRDALTTEQATALGQLLSAARQLIDYTSLIVDPDEHPAPPPEPLERPRPRADVDN